MNFLNNLKTYENKYVINANEFFNALSENSNYSASTLGIMVDNDILVADTVTIGGEVYLKPSCAKFIAFNFKTPNSAAIMTEILNIERRDIIEDMANAIVWLEESSFRYIAADLKTINRIGSIKRYDTERYIDTLINIIDRDNSEKASNKIKYLREIINGLNSFYISVHNDSERLFIKEILTKVYERDLAIQKTSRAGLISRTRTLESENKSLIQEVAELNKQIDNLEEEAGSTHINELTLNEMIELYETCEDFATLVNSVAQDMFTNFLSNFNQR